MRGNSFQASGGISSTGPPTAHLQGGAEAKFGMFIHWGLDIQLRPGNSWKTMSGWPSNFSYCCMQHERPRSRAKLGMPAMTTKHHEGFCLDLR